MKVLVPAGNSTTTIFFFLLFFFIIITILVPIIIIILLTQLNTAINNTGDDADTAAIAPRVGTFRSSRASCPSSEPLPQTASIASRSLTTTPPIARGSDLRYRQPET